MNIKFRGCIFCVTGLILFITACDEPTQTPRPRGFPKVEFPEKTYQTFDADYCHFTFDYPTYAKIQQDTSYFDENRQTPAGLIFIFLHSIAESIAVISH